MKKKFTALMLTCALIFGVFGFSGCTEQITSHNIWVTSSNLQNGSVSGSGVYKDGETATLTATPKGENQFIAWAKNDIVVSKNQTYSFVVSNSMNKDEKYTALFTSNNIDYMVLQDAVYEINGAVRADEMLASKVLSTSLAVSSTPALYNNIVSASNQEFSALGSAWVQNFDVAEKIFYLNKTYYFSFNANIEYTNATTNDITTEPLETKYYIIDFNNLKNGTTSEDVTIYENNEYTLKLVRHVDINTMQITFKNLNNSSTWESGAIQNLTISLTYPFENNLETE